MKRESVIAILVCLLATAVLAKENGGSTAGSSLLRGDIGARVSALGGAGVAAARGAITLRYNPAMLVDLDRRSIFFQYDASILDIRRNDLIYATPWSNGGLAIGGSFIDYGSITRTTISNPGGAGTLNANDFLLRVGYGRHINDRYDVGGSLAYYRLELDKIAANGVTADFGLHAKTSWDGLELGAAIRNIGSRARFLQGSEELPLSATIGLSYQAAARLNIMTDFEWIRGLDGAIKAGLEYDVTRQISLRAGYDGRNEAGSGLTFGAGFKVNSLNIDYAFIPFGDIGNAHRISAEYAFGQTTRREAPSTAYELPRALEPEQSTHVGRPKAAQRPTVVATPPAPASSVAAVDQRGAPVRIKTAPVRSQRTVSEILDDAKEAADAGEPAREEELYREAVKLDPNDATALYNLATVRYLAGDYREARDLYATITGLTPNDVDAWLYLGMCESKLDRATPARRAFDRVLALDPQNAYARQMMTKAR